MNSYASATLARQPWHPPRLRAVEAGSAPQFPDKLKDRVCTGFPDPAEAELAAAASGPLGSYEGG